MRAAGRQAGRCGGRPRCRRAGTLWLALAVVAVLGAAPACAGLDNFLYAPVRTPDDVDPFAATAIPPALREQAAGSVRAADGTPVDAYLLHHDATDPNDETPPSRHGTTLLYCHGNNRNLAAFARRIEALWRQGYTVAAFDYRGYGKTPGVPTEPGLYDDARAVAGWLREHGVAQRQLALYGYSLGAAVCSQLAVELQPPALVLEAPFASIDQLAKDASGMGLPREFFVSARYDTEGKLPSYRGRLLIFHGSRDTYLRPAYGRALARAAEGHAAAVQFVLVPEADHETVPCRLKGASRTPPGDCSEGFDENYLRVLSDSVDEAIAPTALD